MVLLSHSFLTIALFFQFTRLFSIHNLDLLILAFFFFFFFFFPPVPPGFLLVQEAATPLKKRATAAR